MHLQERNSRREIAITFDDLPATYGPNDLERLTYVTKQLLMTIKSNNVPAIGFVNEGKLHARGALDARIALLRMWLDAGLDLGNHTFSHIAIDQVPLAAYEEDVIRGETVIKKLLSEKGMKLRYFRHTQLRTGPTVEYKLGLEKFLAARGYTVAPVTTDNNDFIFAALYGDAKVRGDKATMKRRGYKFISLEDALKDKAYLLPDAQVAQGLSWIHRWRLAKGMTLRLESGEPQFITQLFRERQR